MEGPTKLEVDRWRSIGMEGIGRWVDRLVSRVMEGSKWIEKQLFLNLDDLSLYMPPPPSILFYPVTLSLSQKGLINIHSLV